MKRTPTRLAMQSVPRELQPFLHHAHVYDSSCSPEARVYFLDKEDGYYLKTAPRGTLKTEAEVTRYFHKKGLAAEVLAYLSAESDWLLTARVPGEDCTHKQYAADPKRLSSLLGERLRALHETPASDCPILRRDSYLAAVKAGYESGACSYFHVADPTTALGAEAAWHVVCEGASLLEQNTLIHGDYCLPNILLDNWNFSGFIDLGGGGLADRHIDLFWGVWTLQYNHKTDAYRDRFLDAYGRDAVDPVRLALIEAAETFG